MLPNSPVSNLSGHALNALMRQAGKDGNRSLWSECFARAKELMRGVRNYLSWIEAKMTFDRIDAPKFEGVDFYEVLDLPSICGYPVQAIQSLNEDKEPKHVYACIMNPKTNDCYVKFYLKNGEVIFK